MIHKLYEYLRERDIDGSKLDPDDAYQAGIDNVKENIAFYFDKTYTCESVIKELFFRGVKKYIDKKAIN